MSERQRQWLTLELLKTTEEFFRQKKIDDARLEAEILLAHVLQTSRIELYLNHNRPVFPNELDAFRQLCKKRLTGMPLHYILNEQVFFGFPFTVDERVLIPRPETELVLESAVRRLPGGGVAQDRGFEILDIGTGSGCLAVTLALILPKSQITAVDLSAAALDVAALNARRHGVTERIRFLQTDALHPGFAAEVGKTYDLVISNPPYIPESEWPELQQEIREHEPKMALVAPDPFAFYRAITASASALLCAGGLLCYELHADGAESVKAIVEAAGFENIGVESDYNRLDRVLSGVWRG